MQLAEKLEQLNYPLIEPEQLFGSESPEKLMKETKGIFSSLDSGPREAKHLGSYINFLLSIASKTDAVIEGETVTIEVDAESVAQRLTIASESVLSYPSKLMNAMAGSNSGLALQAPSVEVDGFYSGNTNLMLKQNSYAGGAAALGYGKVITASLYTSKGLTNLFDLMAKHPQWAMEVLSHSCLASESERLVSNVGEIVRTALDQHKSDRIDPTIKQIYFPVGDDFHLLAIMNHGGLRKAVSDYMVMSRAASIESDPNDTKAEKNGWPGVRYVTLKMQVGGTNSQNSGEIINSMVGSLAMLSAKAPSYVPQNGIRPGQVSSIKASGNIFSLMRSLTVNLDAPKKPFHKRLLGYERRPNIHNKAAAGAVFGDLLREVMAPVMLFLDEIEAVGDDCFEKMSPGLQKWVDGERFPGSITADDYREIEATIYDAFSKKVKIMLEGEELARSDAMNLILKQKIKEFVRDY